MGCTHGKESSENQTQGVRISRGPSTNEKILNAKVVFLGDAGVGKSSIFQRYVNNKINQTYEVTIGGAYLEKKVQLKNGSYLRLHLWDTGGEERFKAMASLYYRDANAAILVYDVTDVKTFKSLEDWARELDSKVKQENMTIVVAANKSDVDDDKKKVSHEMVKRFCEYNNMTFFEVSALTGTGVAEMFQYLAETVAKNLPLINNSRSQKKKQKKKQQQPNLNKDSLIFVSLLFIITQPNLSYYILCHMDI